MVRAGEFSRISPHARAWEGPVPGAEERVPRRLAAIQAGEVVGCSRLMAEDADVWPANKVYCTGVILEFTAEAAAANRLRSDVRLASSGGLEEEDSCG